MVVDGLGALAQSFKNGSGQLLPVAGEELDGIDEVGAAVVGAGGGVGEEVAADFDGFAACVADEAFGGNEGQFALVGVIGGAEAEGPDGRGVGVGGGDALEAAEDGVKGGGMPAEVGFGEGFAGLTGGQEQGGQGESEGKCGFHGQYVPPLAGLRPGV